MELESKVLSKQIQEYLYNYDGTQRSLGTAESCTVGRVAETIMSVPGSSNYYKGSVIAYSNEVKENILGVDAQLIEEKTAVSEEVAVAMVKGACKALNVTYSIVTTGIAGPAGALPNAPVGTIWIAYGTADKVRTFKIEEDNGRDLNIAAATQKALQLFLDFLKEEIVLDEE